MVTAWGPVTRRVVAAAIALVVLKPFFNHSEVCVHICCSHAGQFVKSYFSEHHLYLKVNAKGSRFLK